MAMTRSQYQSFRKKGGSLTSQSNYALTLTRQQKSAEDSYYDNAYESGVISAEQYIKNLTERLYTRSWLTPLQKQNLSEKIQATQSDYQDSLIETAYKTGGTYNGKPVDIKYMYDREKAKLDAMVPGSEAYNKQQTKVTQYEEKMVQEEEANSRAERKQFRADKLLELSTMTEKSSVEQRAKADMYEQLQNMALADGENAEAQGYEIQKNNLTQSADASEVTEKLQDISLEQSTPIDPLSRTPAGGTIPSGGGARTGASSAPSIPTGGASNPQTPAQQPTAPTQPEYAQIELGGVAITLPKEVAEALSGDAQLARYSNRIGSIAQQINGDEGKNNGLMYKLQMAQSKLGQIQELLNNANAANRDRLMTAYNNALETVENLKSQIDGKIGEANELSAGYQEKVMERAIALTDNYRSSISKQGAAKLDELEAKLAEGKLQPQDYANQRFNIVHSLKEDYGVLTDAFSAMGADSQALSAEDKYRSLEDDANAATYTKDVADKGLYRLVQSEDKGNSGKFMLVNPAEDVDPQDPNAVKEAVRAWDDTHIQAGGKWYEAKANAVTQTGELDLNKNQQEAARSKNQFFYTKYDKNGNATNVPIKAVDYEDEDGTKITKYVTEEEANKYVSNGYFTQQGDRLVRNYNMGEPGFLDKVKEGALNVGALGQKAMNYINQNKNNTVTVNPPNVGGFIEKAKQGLSGIANKVGSIPVGSGEVDGNKVVRIGGEPIPGGNNTTIGGFLQKAKDFIQNLGVKQARAADIAPTTPQPEGDGNDQALIEKALTAVPANMQPGAKQAIPLIMKALKEQGILNENTLAYALATVQHETGGTFQPIEEYGGRSQAKKLGYSGGENYYGRGYIQLTHDYNYADMDKKLGLNGELIKNPELAKDPEIAARILATFMKDRGVTKYTDAGDFVGARKPINGKDKAQMIGKMATSYANALKSQQVAQQAPVSQIKNMSLDPEKNQSMSATVATQYQPKQESQSFIQKAIDAISSTIAPKAKAAEPMQSYMPQNKSTPQQSSNNNSSQQMSSQPQNYSPAPAKQTSAPMSVYKPPMSVMPKVSTPAPKPASNPVQNVVNTVKSAAGSAFNWLKGLFKW